MQKLSGVYKCLTRESRDQLLLSLSVWFLALFDSVLIKITSEEKKPLVTFFFFFLREGGTICVFIAIYHVLLNTNLTTSPCTMSPNKDYRDWGYGAHDHHASYHGCYKPGTPISIVVSC